MKFNSPKTVVIVSLTTITTFTHANQSSELEQLRAEVNELRQMLQVSKQYLQIAYRFHTYLRQVLSRRLKKILKLYSNGKQNQVPMLICMALFVLILPISLKVRKVCLTALMVCY